jgi:hypothetical protein
VLGRQWPLGGVGISWKGVNHDEGNDVRSLAKGPDTVFLGRHLTPAKAAKVKTARRRIRVTNFRSRQKVKHK